MSVQNVSHNQIQFAVFNKTATGDLVSAITSKKIRVIAYAFVASAAFTVTFTSGTGPTSITGPMSVAANGGVSYTGGIDAPAFETASGEKLAVTLSGTGTVAGHIAYVAIAPTSAF